MGKFSGATTSTFGSTTPSTTNTSAAGSSATAPATKPPTFSLMQAAPQTAPVVLPVLQPVAPIAPELRKLSLPEIIAFQRSLRHAMPDDLTFAYFREAFSHAKKSLVDPAMCLLDASALAEQAATADELLAQMRRSGLSTPLLAAHKADGQARVNDMKNRGTANSHVTRDGFDFMQDDIAQLICPVLLFQSGPNFEIASEWCGQVSAHVNPTNKELNLDFARYNFTVTEAQQVVLKAPPSPELVELSQNQVPIFLQASQYRISIPLASIDKILFNASATEEGRPAVFSLYLNAPPKFATRHFENYDWTTIDDFSPSQVVSKVLQVVVVAVRDDLCSLVAALVASDTHFGMLFNSSTSVASPAQITWTKDDYPISEEVLQWPSRRDICQAVSNDVIAGVLPDSALGQQIIQMLASGQIGQVEGVDLSKLIPQTIAEDDEEEEGDWESMGEEDDD